MIDYPIMNVTVPSKLNLSNVDAESKKFHQGETPVHAFTPT